jgi:ubiquitin-conjugating enzyme E2 J2
MLSDEMTTGSVTSSDAHKRAFAARSHAWNLTQPRFRDAFPEVSCSLRNPSEPAETNRHLQYSTPEPRELPNMGEKERGKPDTASSPSTGSSESQSSQTPVGLGPTSTALHGTQPATNGSANSASLGGSTPSHTHGSARGRPDEVATNRPGAAPGWIGSLRQVIWEKWRWCAVIALAVMVSRFSTAS